MKTVIYYYSATGSTKKIAGAFAKAFKDVLLFPVLEGITVPNADLLVFAAPVYGGRIPKAAMNQFRTLCLPGKAVVGITVYGNMSFGASLKQFKKLTRDHGCQLIGVGAFVSKHTYSTKEAPICEERPDYADILQAEGLGREIIKKMQESKMSEVKLPFSLFPRQAEYVSESLIRLAVKKPVVTGKCTQCGMCASACPCVAIDARTLSIDNTKCSRCFACVKVCPNKARRNEFTIKKLKYPFAWLGKKEKKNLILL